MRIPTLLVLVSLVSGCSIHPTVDDAQSLDWLAYIDTYSKVCYGQDSEMATRADNLVTQFRDKYQVPADDYRQYQTKRAVEAMALQNGEATCAEIRPEVAKNIGDLSWWVHREAGAGQSTEYKPPGQGTWANPVIVEVR